MAIKSSGRITVEFPGGREVECDLAGWDGPDPTIVELRAGSFSARIGVDAVNARALAAFFAGHAERVESAAPAKRAARPRKKGGGS